MLSKQYIQKCSLVALLLTCYLFSAFALKEYMKNKPFVEKLGYIPSVGSMKVMVAEHKRFLSASLMMKVQIYFGSLIEKSPNKLQVPADYPAMSRTIDAALKLDPYNMDCYYFAQAILAWDVGKADLANIFLENGMKYRDWDWQLPYFAGFNYAYFLHDYDRAAYYYQRAARLSGQAMFMTLAGRYMYDAGRTEMAIAYLNSMIRSTNNQAVKNTLTVRRNAFVEVRRVEVAANNYKQVKGILPKSIEDLLHTGFIQERPQDPYGGVFFIDSNGKVKSTSGFAFAPGSQR